MWQCGVTLASVCDPDFSLHTHTYTHLHTHFQQRKGWLRENRSPTATRLKRLKSSSLSHSSCSGGWRGLLRFRFLTCKEDASEWTSRTFHIKCHWRMKNKAGALQPQRFVDNNRVKNFRPEPQIKPTNSPASLEVTGFLQYCFTITLQMAAGFLFLVFYFFSCCLMRQ